jgi:peroxiredoxin
MRKTLIALTLLATTLLTPTSPAHASLTAGAKAPQFTAQASIGGRVFTFNLAASLRHGPVVLYFYPAAFTAGCTVEAHDFAAAMPQFHALHATVIGVSMDGIAILKKFSVSECRSKFPVASDQGGTISRAYDAVMQGAPNYADRTSYVIAPTGRIIATYHSLDPDGHVAHTMAAVKTWDAAHPTTTHA